MKLKKLTFKEATSENPLDWSEMRKIKGGASPTTPIPLVLWCECNEIPGTWTMNYVSDQRTAYRIQEHCGKGGGECVPYDRPKPNPSPVTR